jgi:hypothetical protein
VQRNAMSSIGGIVLGSMAGPEDLQQTVQWCMSHVISVRTRFRWLGQKGVWHHDGGTLLRTGATQACQFGHCPAGAVILRSDHSTSP